MSLEELIGKRGATAVRKHAKRVKATVFLTSDRIEFHDEYGDVVGEICRDRDGRWVLAFSDPQRNQFCGHSRDGAAQMGQGYRYTTARTLRGLRDLGVSS